MRHSFRRSFEASPPLRRLLGAKRSKAFSVAGVAIALASACSSESRSVYMGRATEQPGFTPPDASAAEALDTEATFTLYCPSSECPPGRTTCASSRFRCDVDLNTDRSNCGTCGHACLPAGDGELFECMDGRCVMVCTNGFDCDGLPDNGCEIKEAPNNDHCGACGNKCTDPDKPCVNRNDPLADVDLGCGCRDGDVHCPNAPLQCIRTSDNDANCGGCGIVCDPNEHGGSGVPNETTYFGCLDGECGHLKCKPNQGDCDDNLGNGCESSILTAENCGFCGNACAPGQQCQLDEKGAPICACPAGTTFCPTTTCLPGGGMCRGQCVNLSANIDNCGACGMACAGNSSWQTIAVCNYGTCIRQCEDGWADCNDNLSDGCEIQTEYDPKNCGGCGKVCDAVAGQACVGGRCVVEACNPDAGEVPR